MIVEAAEVITVNLDTNDLHATREVKTVSRPGKGAQASGSAMFNDRDPLYGSATEFWYVSARHAFKYAGAAAAPAQLKQTEESIVIGDEIVFEQDSQNLTAAGHVETTFTLVTDGTATAEPPKRYHATAASMAYDDARHTATYRGNLAVLKEPDGETTAEVIVLSLASAGRSLERLEATGRVRSSLAGGRQALGDRLAYETAKDVYMLWGKPLTLWTKDDDGTCSSQTGNYVSFAGDTGAPNFPGTQNPGGAPLSSKQPCPAFLAPKK